MTVQAPAGKKGGGGESPSPPLCLVLFKEETGRPHNRYRGEKYFSRNGTSSTTNSLPRR